MKKTYFGSRILAALLTLTMVVSFAGVIPGLTASAANPSFDGYIYNGDFETGDGSNWRLASGSSIVEGGHDGSGYAMRHGGSKWSYFSQKINVQPNTDYRLSGWVKRVEGTGAHYLFAKGPNDEKITAINSTHQWFTYTSSDWVYHKWEFNSEDFTSITVLVTIEDSESVFLYDDITLAPLPKPSFDGYLRNGDFELGESGAWALSKTASIVEGGHDGSNYCLRFEGTKWANCNQAITVEANTDYRLTGWVKRVAGSGAHHFYVQDSSNTNCSWLNGTKTWFTYMGEDWVQHVLEFNSGSETQLKLYLSIEDPESIFLYDDIMIEKLATANSDGYITNGDFETGAASGWLLNSMSSIVEGGRNGSDYALRLEGSAGNTVRQSTRVEGMTDYRLTVHSKRVSGTGSNKIYVQRGDVLIESLNGCDGVIDDTGTDWTEHVYEFNSGPATQITVFLQIVDNGTVFLYDDITLEEITGPDYSGVMKGDTDLDGELTEADATLLQQHLAGEITLEDAAAYAADMDYSGTITAEDLAMLNTALDTENAVPVPLYPINGETVAKGAWQVEELLVDYTPGKSDKYSNIAARKDQYARDPVVLRWIAPSGGARSYGILIADNSGLENAKRYQIQNDNLPGEKTLSIQNLLVDTDYYWAVDFNGRVSAVGTFHTAKTVRTLWIEGVSNTRDIGGWLTEDGKYRVKYNVAFRGARFDDITEAGLAAVADLGLKTDVDLRTQNEGVQAPLGDLAEWFLAGKNGAAMYYTEDTSSISDLTSNYVKATVNAIRVYKDESKFPAYFHCSYGRDRTGTLGLLLLGLLGVSYEDIQKDYEMTFLSEWGGGGISASGHLNQIGRTKNWIQETYAPEGTLKEAVEGYLISAGMTADEFAVIRANMLDRIDGEAEATGIEVTTLPTKTEYLEGKDGFVADGGVITVYYSDGSSEEIDLTAEMVSGFDNSVVGEQTLTVEYEGFTATFDVEIIAKTLVRIEITALPAKVEYEAGEEFDPDGLEVTAYYDNGTSEVLASDAYTLEGYEPTVGDHVITVAYGEKMTAYTVTVVSKTLVRIEITALPAKVEYEAGEEFDPDGLEVTAYYDNGTSEVLASDAYTIEGYEATEGEHELTVSFGDKSATFTVTVVITIIPGDLDGDGDITVGDALMALRVAAKLTTFENEALFNAADVDGDGDITVSDALRILRVAAGLVDHL